MWVLYRFIHAPSLDLYNNCLIKSSATGRGMAMAAKTVLITGANRGIGLAFAAHYAAQGWDVIAAARSPDSAAEVRAFAGSIRLLGIKNASTDADALTCAWGRSSRHCG
jgi:NADPH:quinone reductase-like Zn-dependent oxidoreductase